MRPAKLTNHSAYQLRDIIMSVYVEYLIKNSFRFVGVEIVP